MKITLKFIIDRVLFFIDIFFLFCFLNTIIDGFLIRPADWLYWGRDGIVYTSLAFGYLLFSPILISLLLVELITKRQFKKVLYLIYGFFLGILYFVWSHEIHTKNDDLITFYLIFLLPLIAMITLKTDKYLVKTYVFFIVLIYCLWLSTQYIFNDFGNSIHNFLSGFIFICWPVILFIISLPFFLRNKYFNKSSN